MYGSRYVFSVRLYLALIFFVITFLNPHLSLESVYHTSPYPKFNTHIIFYLKIKFISAISKISKIHIAKTLLMREKIMFGIYLKFLCVMYLYSNSKLLIEK